MLNFWIGFKSLVPRWGEKLALYLIYIKGLTGWSKIPLRSAEMEKFGLSPKTRRVQLAKLEGAGLVKADKAVGKKPVVTVIS